MPIYEYQCTDCRKPFEALVRSAATSVTCEHCHGTRVRRLISSFATVHGSSTALAELPQLPRVGGGCACGGSGCACGGH